MKNTSSGSGSGAKRVGPDDGHGGSGDLGILEEVRTETGDDGGEPAVGPSDGLLQNVGIHLLGQTHGEAVGIVDGKLVGGSLHGGHGTF